MQLESEFVRKHRAQLPMKYMRRSLQNLVKRPVKANDIQELQKIDEAFRHYIEMPIKDYKDLS